MNLRDFDALTFDCYGTLIDWEQGILDFLRPWATQHRLEVSDDELLELHGRAESAHEASTPNTLYPKILEAVFADIARHFGIEPEPNAMRAFGQSVRDWPAFDDSPAALRYLKEHYRLVIISNIDHESFAHSRARLGVEFDAVITAQDVGSYKPDPRNFEYAFARLTTMGIERDRILHVAQSLYHDHVPARQLGMHTVWINRRAHKPGHGATLPPGTDVRPDLIVNDLAGLVDLHRAG